MVEGAIVCEYRSDRGFTWRATVGLEQLPCVDGDDAELIGETAVGATAGDAVAAEPAAHAMACVKFLRPH